MSFRIHSTPIQPAPCMIRIKHHQLPKELALAKLEADLDEEYEDELDQKEEPVPAPQYNIKTASSPLPPVVNAPVEAALDETFKLRRKRRS